MVFAISISTFPFSYFNLYFHFAILDIARSVTPIATVRAWLSHEYGSAASLAISEICYKVLSVFYCDCPQSTHCPALCKENLRRSSSSPFNSLTINSTSLIYLLLSWFIVPWWLYWFPMAALTNGLKQHLLESGRPEVWNYFLCAKIKLSAEEP